MAVNHHRGFCKRFYAICSEKLSRLRYYEYWPTRIFYLPIYIKILHWALRLRCLSFFTAVNPGIEFGGMLNYSKHQVLNAIPPKYLLSSKLCYASSIARLSNTGLTESLRQAGLLFPIIAKPDLGERGFGVKIIHSTQELRSYALEFSRLESDSQIILQEYLAPAKEFAILYSRSPEKVEARETGEIRSICAKEPLQVIGDGKSTLWQLIARHPRASRYYCKLHRTWARQWFSVLAKKEVLQLSKIGAHSLGTTCYDYRSHYSAELLQHFEQISYHVRCLLSPANQISFTFGRYDILARNWNAVLKGEFKVIELNGVNAEPLHIYHPKAPLLYSWKQLWAHWQHIGELAQQQIQRRAKPSGAIPLLRAIWQHDLRLRKFAHRKRKSKNAKNS